MADSRNQRELNQLLQQQAEIQTRLNEQVKAAAVLSGQELQDMEDKVASSKIALGIIEQEAKVRERALANNERRQARINALEEQRNKSAEEYTELQNGFASSLSKLSPKMKEMIGAETNGGSTLVSLNQKILNLKENELNLSVADRAINDQKIASLTAIQDSYIEEAQALDTARLSMFGIAESEQRRIEFQNSLNGLTEDEIELATQLYNQRENIRAQQERYNMLSEQANGIVGMLPSGLQSVVGGIKNMITGIRAFGLQAAIATAGITLIVGAIVAGLKYFMDLEQAGEDFRKETGVTNSMMGDMNEKASNIAKNFGSVGVSMEDAYDTMKALRDEIGEVANYSEATVASLTLMKTNFGVSAEEAAKVQNIFESVGGLSEQTAASVQQQAANMAKLAGVAPKKVIKDIAENAEAASTFFKGDLTALTRNAVQAQRMGTSLKQQVSLAEKLLDFEGGIEDELVAATFVGGQFNLSRARALAMEGKLAQANKETLTQIQRSGDFRKQDYFTQQQLAKAAGMSVEEINKQLNTQEKLSRLSTEDQKKAQAAIDAGLDITNINDEQLMQEVQKAAAQKEMASTISDIENTFKGILASVGGSLLPIFQMLGPVLKFAFFPLKLAAKAIQFIIDGIMWLLKKIPGVSSLVDTVSDFAGQADAAVTNFSVSSMEKGGLKSSTDESTSAGSINDGVVQDGKIVSTNPADTLIATKSPSELLSNVLSMTPIGMAANAVGSMMGGGNSGINANGINQLIAELKGLRADMSSGKIGVNMDGAKVTAGVSNQINKNTRNNFTIA